MNLIAYGSLMNQRSLNLTMRRSTPLRKIEISGYQRVFNAPFDGYAFLNLQKAAGGRIEAASFETSEEELALFAVREAGSQLVEIAQGHFAFVWPNKYTVKLPVLQSYINICTDGANKLEINFLQGLVPPSIIVNDSKTPLYT